MNRFASVTRPLMWFMALLFAALAAGCGGGGGGSAILGSPGLISMVSLAVTPATVSVPVTGTYSFTAIATYSDGSSKNVTTTSTWASGTPGVATISNITPTIGLATGVAAGTSNITAAYGGKTATATLTVNAATPKSFVVTPTAVTVPVGGAQQFAAIQTFSDGTTFDRTATSTWSTSGPSAANAAFGDPVCLTIGCATGKTVTPINAPVIVNATFAGLVATPATLNVTAATSVSFVVKPAAASISVGGTQQFAAIETFSDGTTSDRTTASVWTSGTPGVASISNTAPTIGLATGVAAGTSNITAAYGGQTATATLTVSAATVTSIGLTPATASILVNGKQQYTAIATKSDGTTVDVTANAATSWASSNAAVASLSPSGIGGGSATGNSVGTAGITAAYGGKTSPAATLNVINATVTSINVTPATASILVGGTQQYSAIAILSDGSSTDVTSNVGTVWTSASPLVATISNTAPTIGLATGVAAGTSNITAAYGGKTSPAAVLTVTAVNTGPAGPLPNLKTATPYGIMAWDAMTVNAGSHIYGDVALPGGVIASVTGTGGVNDGGVAPNLTSSAVTNSAGVTPGQINATNNGTLTPAQLTQLQADLNSVYTTDLQVRLAPVTPLTTIASAANQPGGTFAAATDLSGYVLSPGVYTSPATYGLSSALGPLVLDAKGNPNAVFIIRSTQAGPSGITSTTGSVVLQGGAQAKNVFWVMDNATIGGNTFFQGTLVAGHVITLNGGAIVQGRMLAGALGLVSGAITLTGNNTVTVPQ